MNERQIAHLETQVNSLEQKIDALLRIINGDGQGGLGVLQKVEVMWRYGMVWPLCTMSAAAGGLFLLAIQKLIKLL